jgi:hypothetical protein
MWRRDDTEQMLICFSGSPEESDSINLVRPAYGYLDIFTQDFDITCRQELLNICVIHVLLDLKTSNI